MTDSFSVGISRDGDWLHSKIVLKSELEVQTNYFFNILKDDVIIHRSGWTAGNTYSFRLKEHGEYKLQGHIRYEGKNMWKRSDSIMFYERPIKYTQKDFKVTLEKKESKLVCEIIGVQNPNQ